MAILVLFRMAASGSVDLWAEWLVTARATGKNHSIAPRLRALEMESPLDFHRLGITSNCTLNRSSNLCCPRSLILTLFLT